MSGNEGAVDLHVTALDTFRIADRLRQGPGQVLANVLVELRTLLALPTLSDEQVRSLLTALASELEAGYWELQEIVEELRPPFLLREVGFAAWLEAVAERYAERYGLQVHLHVNGVDEFPMSQRVALARVVQESLRNVREHARATEIHVRVYREGSEVILEVEDNGRGVDVRALNGRYREIHPKDTFGLPMMHYWLGRIGGSLTVHSRPEGGTVVRAAMPYLGEEVIDAQPQETHSPDDRGGSPALQRGPETGPGDGRGHGGGGRGP